MVWPLIIGALLTGVGQEQQAVGEAEADRALSQTALDEFNREQALQSQDAQRTLAATSSMGVPGQVQASEAAAAPLAAQVNTGTNDVTSAFAKADNQGSSADLAGAISAGSTGESQRARATGVDAATLFGVGQGFATQGQRLQQLGLDQNRIAEELQSDQEIYPFLQNAAGMKGSARRSLGQTASNLGQLLMQYDMWSKGGGDSGTGKPGATPVTSDSKIVAPDTYSARPVMPKTQVPVGSTSLPAGLWA